MSWVLLLIQLIPGIINAIMAILDAIKKLRGPEKLAAKKELVDLAKRHVKRRRGAKDGEPKHVLLFGQATCEADMACLLAKLQKPQN